MKNSNEDSKYFAADRPEIVSFAAEQGNFGYAIDIGCATGKLGKTLLAKNIVARCDGIELTPEAARVATQNLHQVWPGSLESNQENVPWEQYDLLIMADVLEHLADPWSALKQLRSKTRTDCKLLLSIPNIRHYKVVLPLLFKDEFRYRDHGIMDSTHLHFYTASSIVETLNECGWKVTRRDSHMKRSYRRWYMPTRLLEPFVAVQYLLMAEKQ